MNCPVCSVPLIVVERHGIELDYCVECKGLWFDAGELRLLGEALKLDIEVPDIDSLPEVDAPEKYRRCPRCEKRMEKTSLDKDDDLTILDRCPRGHGLWFDHKELGRVVRGHSRYKDEELSGVVRFLGETLRESLDVDERSEA